MKKIMNRPEDMVSEMIQGIAFAHPELSCFPKKRVVARREKREKVGLVSGGGSGHEPAHAGYVGTGMLDAAVAGNVFASPSPDQMLEGIRQANTGKGVLFILKNYTGDLMNFSMAKEFAEMEGIKVDSVVVKDDAAIPDSDLTAGRRGIAGTVLVQKVAGAAAEEGASLAEVKRIAQKAIDRVRTVGLSMSACILPGLDKPGFTVKEGEMEVGMGIHGEPGVEKCEAKPAKEIAHILFDHLNKDYDFSGKRVAMLVNGLGGTPLMELYVLCHEMELLLEEKGIQVANVLVGNHMTALEMAGCSVSLMDLDDELAENICMPCCTPGLKIMAGKEVQGCN